MRKNLGPRVDRRKFLKGVAIASAAGTVNPQILVTRVITRFISDTSSPASATASGGRLCTSFRS